MHPWTTEGGTESTLLLFNHSSVPQTFEVLITSGGVLWQKNYKLQPMETKPINIGDLIANKIKDDSGKTIPPSSTSGVATWILGPHGVGKGRLLQSNAGTGMARSFSCGEYATVGGAIWKSNTSAVPVGSSVDVGGVVSLIDLVTSGYGCTGTYEATQNAINWEFSYSSSNSSIATATLNADGSTVNVQGISGGSATITGEVEDPSENCYAFAQSNVTVQVPTSLSIVAGSDSTTSEASCSAGTSETGCGVTRSFTYQVNDQTGAPLLVAGYQVWDSIATTSPNNLGITGYTTTCTAAGKTNSGPCGVATNSNGQFAEQQPICSTVCRVNNACVTGGPTNANQTVHVGPSTIVQSLSYYCNRVTVNGQ